MRREARGGPHAPRRRASTSRGPARGLTLAQQQIGRDRQGHLAQRPGAHHGRADRVARLRTKSTQLFRIIASPARQGVAILFICHRMEEVFADRRHGSRCSATDAGSRRGRVAEVTPSSAIRRHGRARGPGAVQAAPESHPGEVVLSVQGLGRGGRLRRTSVRPARGRGARLRRAGRRRRTDVGLALFGIAPATRAPSSSTASRSRSAAPRSRSAAASPTRPRTAASWASSSRCRSPRTSPCRPCPGS